MTLTRGSIGNVRQNDALTEMAMGYARSRVLCAAARLGLADALGDHERTVKQLAQVCQADVGALHRLLRALATIGVVAETTTPGRFVLTPFGQPLRKDAPDSQWAGVVFWADLLADNWSYLTECVRTGEKAMRIMESRGVTPRWFQDPDAHSFFCAVMGTAPAEDYAPIARAWDFSRYNVVADLGGGGGALIAAVLTAYPELRGMLVDRQESVDRAKARFESDGSAGRCQLLGIDLSQSVPAGADVYMLKHVLHGCQDDDALVILRNCRAVVPPEGRVLVIEFILPEIVDHPDEELESRCMSDLNMLVVTGGKERTANEWRALLQASGFACRSIVPVAGELVSIVEAAPV